MAKGKGKPTTTAAPKANQKTVSRSRKSSFERKSLSKSAKRLFAGSSGVVFRLIDRLEKKLKEKVKKVEQNVKN